MSDDIIKRLREAIAEHPLSPIHGYAADIAALLDRLDKLAGEHAMMKSLLLSEQVEKREISAECERLRGDINVYRNLAESFRSLVDTTATIKRIKEEYGMGTSGDLIERLREALLPFVDEGIELNCDECGGDQNKCNASCVVRKGRAAIDAARAAEREEE